MKMSSKIFKLFLLFVLPILICVKGDCSSDDKKVSNVQKLRNYLFKDCKYDKEYHPKLLNEGNKTLYVKMTFFHRYFTYDYSGHTITIHGTLKMIWNDDRLQWHTDDFGSRSQFTASDKDIWFPQFFLIKGRDFDYVQIFDTLRCRINYNGTINCETEFIIEGLCIADVYYYPFDKQSCILYFGMTEYTSQSIVLKLYYTPLFIDNNPEFETPEVKPRLINDSKPETGTIIHSFFSMKYTFQRRDSIYVATILTPALILALLVITTAFMDLENPQRLNVGGCSLLCHILFVDHVFWQISSNGEQTPLIVTYCRDSTILCSVILILTIIFKKIARFNFNCPYYLDNLIIVSANHKFGTHLFTYGYSPVPKALKLDEDNKPSENKSKSSWVLLVSFLNISTIIIYCLIYIVLFSAFLPANRN